MPSNTILEHSIPSEENIESFLRGESSLEFRSCFGIDINNARLVTADGKKAKKNDSEQQFVAIKGIATTAETDDNGVEVVPSALRSLPKDFSRRTTVLFNHNMDMPIGRLLPNKSTKFIRGRNSRVEVDPVLIDVDARLQTGQRVVDAIERGTLNKFSFAWSTRDGIIVFGKNAFQKATDKELKDLGLDPEEDVLGSFRIGLDSAPFVRVFSLVGVELSVVSVPADAGADFGVASFSRNLERVISRYSRSSQGQIFVPSQFRNDSEEEISIPIKDGRIEFREESLETQDSDDQEEYEDEELFYEDLRDILREEIFNTLNEWKELNSEETSEVTNTRSANTPYKKVKAINRPWDASAATKRLANWAKGEDEKLDLSKSKHRNKYAQGFIGYRNDGEAKQDYILPHHDIVDGSLVSNFRGVVAATQRLNQTDFDGLSEDKAKKHLFNEYTKTHEVDAEDVPDVLKSFINELKGGVDN